MIATDNGSVDGSLEILQRYEQRGRLRLLQEPDHTHDQAVWVTRMARMAAREFNANWVINGDADEFWYPMRGSLQATLMAIPEEIKAISVDRSNFLPPPRDAEDQRPFHERQTLRERQSCNSLGEPLPPKVIHRAHPRVEISDGNHSASVNGKPLPAPASEELEILHLPIRSYQQFERKIRQGAEALERNERLDPGIGHSWRSLYRNHLRAGTLPQYYDGLRPDAQSLAAQLASGALIEDTRLQQALQARPWWRLW
ncbi:glycosyltransferase family 2 protein [Synechococcus sp. CC9616]|uniref:glycosyltransferase family 2 protein n=1 Tax=Synechococcus sp. CC9616 TaxID=110663 RepID=UPI0009FCC47C